MKSYPNILIVSGTGRNTGKTTLVCSIIKKFSKEQEIVAVKITPHFYDFTPENALVINDRFVISEEKNVESTKDSSLMLKSGAKKVYFIQVFDNNLEEAFNKLLNLIDENSLIICESARLRKHIKPGVFVLMNNKETFEKNSDLAQYADIVSSFDTIIETERRIAIKNKSFTFL